LQVFLQKFFNLYFRYLFVLCCAFINQGKGGGLMNRQNVGEKDTTCLMEMMELMNKTCLQLAQKLNLLERENQKLENLLRVRVVADQKEKQDS